LGDGDYAVPVKYYYCCHLLKTESEKALGIYCEFFERKKKGGPWEEGETMVGAWEEAE
jgi:hypothetical protein